jgi:hypothetical protein
MYKMQVYVFLVCLLILLGLVSLFAFRLIFLSRYAKKSGVAMTQSTEFEVSKVEPVKKLLPELPYFESIELLLNPPQSEFADIRKKIQRKTLKKEACANYQDTLVGKIEFHPVMAALHNAYHGHRPLCLSPDMIWLMICQGLANHINVHSEKLRPLLVKHQGKLKITVRRDDFTKGSNNNPWTEVFSEFSATIRKHIGEKTHDLIMPDFSTTGLVEKAATEIVLMDAVQSYFEYECHTMCGIPRIKLEGTLDDWQVLLNRTKDLARFELEWWINPLLPILKQFIAAVQGNPDQNFWQSIYKMDNESGGPYITGWITAFFPYLKDWETQKATRQNESLIKDEEALRKLLYPFAIDNPRASWTGLTTEKFPSGLSTSPFVWEYYEQAYEMEFLGGFVGIRQNSDDFFLRPEIGWAVYEVIWNHAIDVDDD